MSPYHVNVVIHLLAAMLWLGGMFFFAAVGAPVLRSIEPPELRQALFERLGRRFRSIGWAAVGVLLMTGVLNLQFRGLLESATLLRAEFWGTTYGRFLALKLTCVVLMIVLGAVHDFVLGPAASRAAPGTPQAAALRHRSAWIARINAVVGLILIVAAVRLVR
ncbi:MAG TPA: DUF4149 domain-containing protein [Gemmatimonadales bacterium]|jgi:uncharacterized membrane protein